ncbi:MAG: hypothetical protein IPJ07_06245 [Acidobacteria bacterium]|nr:hypothetical protein [Acidobacteriota bacterium]
MPLYLDDSTVGGGKRFNRAAFAIPTGRQGTLGRNALRGFSIYQWDLGVRRMFKIAERANLQFKAEIFNILNHPNFGDPSGTLPTWNPNHVRDINGHVRQEFGYRDKRRRFEPALSNRWAALYPTGPEVAVLKRRLRKAGPEAGSQRLFTSPPHCRLSDTLPVML